MAQSVAIRPRLPMPTGLPNVSPAQWRVLTDAIFPGAKTGEAIALALDYCAARKLDPFKRPVHVVPMYNTTLKRTVETVWPGINELEITAARTGSWAGMDEPKWGPTKQRTFSGMVGRGDERAMKTVTIEYPEWCSVTVYRIVKGAKSAFAEPVYWEECFARVAYGVEVPNDIWQKRRRGQLHKCAKAASLRAAFPEDVSDYSAEEMEYKEIAEGGIVIEGEAEPEVDTQQATKGSEEVQPKRQTISEWLDSLDISFRDAADSESIDSILARDDVQSAQDRFQGDARDRLTKMIQAALQRFQTPPPDIEGPWSE